MWEPSASVKPTACAVTSAPSTGNPSEPKTARSLDGPLSHLDGVAVIVVGRSRRVRHQHRPSGSDFEQPDAPALTHVEARRLVGVEHEDLVPDDGRVAALQRLRKRNLPRGVGIAVIGLRNQARLRRRERYGSLRLGHPLDPRGLRVRRPARLLGNPVVRDSRRVRAPEPKESPRTQRRQPRKREAVPVPSVPSRRAYRCLIFSTSLRQGGAAPVPCVYSLSQIGSGPPVLRGCHVSGSTPNAED